MTAQLVTVATAGSPLFGDRTLRASGGPRVELGDASAGKASRERKGSIREEELSQDRMVTRGHSIATRTQQRSREELEHIQDPEGRVGHSGLGRSFHAVQGRGE